MAALLRDELWVADDDDDDEVGVKKDVSLHEGRKRGRKGLLDRDFSATITTRGLILDSRVDGSIPIFGDGDKGKTEVEKPTHTHTASGQLAELPCRYFSMTPG